MLLRRRVTGRDGGGATGAGGREGGGVASGAVGDEGGAEDGEETAGDAGECSVHELLASSAA